MCLGEYDAGELLRRLPRCGHDFHLKCIDAWLSQHSTCPNCRAPLVPDAVRARLRAGAPALLRAPLLLARRAGLCRTWRPIQRDRQAPLPQPSGALHARSACRRQRRSATVRRASRAAKPGLSPGISQAVRAPAGGPRPPPGAHAAACRVTGADARAPACAAQEAEGRAPAGAPAGGAVELASGQPAAAAPTDASPAAPPPVPPSAHPLVASWATVQAGPAAAGSRPPPEAPAERPPSGHPPGAARGGRAGLFWLRPLLAPPPGRPANQHPSLLTTPAPAPAGGQPALPDHPPATT